MRKAFIIRHLARGVSKAHDPHWRYIALRIEGRAVSRRALQNALLGRARKEGVPDAEAPQLTRYDWPHAIVKVHHHRLAGARDWLPRLDFAVEGDAKVPLQVKTLSASGTIKALTQRLGILEKRGEERPDGRVLRKDASGAARPEGGSASDGPGRDARVTKPTRGPAPRRDPGSEDSAAKPSGPVAPPGRSKRATRGKTP